MLSVGFKNNCHIQSKINIKITIFTANQNRYYYETFNYCHIKWITFWICML